MNRIASTFCLAAIAGCIENPGPDADLNHRYLKPVIHSYDGPVPLQADLIRKDDRISVSVRVDSSRTAGLGLDSVEIFIHRGQSFYGSPPFLADGSGRINFHGTDRNLLGDGTPIGSVEDHMPARALAEEYRLWVLGAWAKGGKEIGVGLAGRYKGTWAHTDTSGFTAGGEATYLISNSGLAEAGMTVDGDPGNFWGLKAAVGLDSTVSVYQMITSGRSFGAPIGSPLTTKATSNGDSLNLDMGFEGKYKGDSLVFRCARVRSP